MRRKHIKTDLEKSKELLDIINSTEIYKLSYRDILDQAISYCMYDDKINYNEKELERIMVNSIRHYASNYLDLNRRVNKIHRTYTNDDHYQYRNSVLDRIAIEYGFLKSECFRQKHSLNMVKINDK